MFPISSEHGSSSHWTFLGTSTAPVSSFWGGTTNNEPGRSSSDVEKNKCQNSTGLQLHVSHSNLTEDKKAIMVHIRGTHQARPSPTASSQPTKRINQWGPIYCVRSTLQRNSNPEGPKPFVMPQQTSHRFIAVRGTRRPGRKPIGLQSPGGHTPRGV